MYQNSTTCTYTYVHMWCMIHTSWEERELSPSVYGARDYALVVREAGTGCYRGSNQVSPLTTRMDNLVFLPEESPLPAVAL